MPRLRHRPRPGQPRGPRNFPLSRPGAGAPKPAPAVVIPLPPPFDPDPGQFWVRDARGRIRGRRIPKPRVPWARRPPRAPEWVQINCGNRTIRWAKDPGAQVKANWTAKNCGPRRSAREFNPGGAESGTLAGARRAEGLFDYGWGTDFPLTRREQKALQEGAAVPDPFFAPPTTANPGNYIADRIEALRRRFGRTEYSTASDISKLCGPGGSGITCEGPDGGISWRSTTATLTKEDVDRFRAAYCDPGTCQEPGRATPPAGFTETVIKGRPANPGTAGRVRCTSEPTLRVIGPALEPLPPTLEQIAAPAPEPGDPGCPPAHAWTVGLTGFRCTPIAWNLPRATDEQLASIGIFRP